MMDEIELTCQQCNDKFVSIIWVDVGPQEFCCSDECYEDYYSKVEIRDRRLKLILNEI